MTLINASQWIADVGKWLGPIILALGTIYFTVKELVAKFNKRRDKKKDKTAMDLLTKLATSDAGEISNKNSKKIEHLEQEVTTLKKVLKTESARLSAQSVVLAEMFSLVFENSTLSPEVKERLRVLKTKIDCPSESELLEELMAQNNILREEVKHSEQVIETLKDNAQVKITKDVEADTTSKKTVNQTIIQ